MIAVRHRFSSALAALTAFAWLAGGVAARAQGNCTMDQLAGSYVYESHGSITFALAPTAPIE